MPNKNFTLDSGLIITVYKRKASRSLRLSIDPSGQIKVSIPLWAPYKVGISFAQSRQDWIRAQQPMVRLLQDGQTVGKAHYLRLMADESLAKPATRIDDATITVRYPAGLSPGDPIVQHAAREASVRALRKQAEQLLPQRLASLAAEHDFHYKSVGIKQLKARWGSCDQHGHIVLNLFLMQLPWELIDYVLLHELTHTVILRHGPDFWSHLGQVLPDFARHKKTIRDYHPILMGVA